MTLSKYVLKNKFQKINKFQRLIYNDQILIWTLSGNALSKLARESGRQS